MPENCHHQAQKQNRVTNFRHETVFLDDADRRLLSRLDGSRGRDELVEIIRDQGEEMPASPEEILDQKLTAFAKNALLAE